MPLYIRAGSIIPLGADLQYATEHPADTIELRIYPGANGKFDFYEDENDSYNYEKGKFSRFTLSYTERDHLLRISESRGSYPGMLKQRVFHLILVGMGHGADVAPLTSFDKTLVYKGQAVAVHL